MESLANTLLLKTWFSPLLSAVFLINSGLPSNNSLNSKPIVNSKATPAVVPAPARAVPSPQLIQLRRAIIGQESGANFSAVNPHSGALGYAQIMPENLPHWSKQAIGRSVSSKEFLSNPELQLAIIDHRLNLYWQDALRGSKGNEEIAVRQVASRWYSGKPHLYTSTRIQYYNGHPYPSIASYTLSVLKKFKLLAANPMGKAGLLN